MKYLLMVFYDEKKLNALSEPEFQALTEEALDYDDVLRKGGHFIAAQALQSVHSASTLGYGWSFRRDERADRRIYPDRGKRPQRSHPSGVEGSTGATRRH
jgi:hypothetical protein